MTFLEYMAKKHPGQNNNDAKSVYLLCQEAQNYANLMVRKTLQSVIDYEAENGRTPICNDEERGANEYSDIFLASEGIKELVS